MECGRRVRSLGHPSKVIQVELLVVSFSPDGRQVVSGSYDETLRLWDAETFTEIGNPFEGHSDDVDCVSFSSDGHRIVSGGFDKTVRVWNVATREEIGDPLIGHTGLGQVGC